MNVIEQKLTPLVGQYVWGVDWDCQLSLRMNFGDPHLCVMEPLRSRPVNRIVMPRGQWWLWVYFAYWKISFNGVRVGKGGTAKSRSSFKRIMRATTDLQGQIVTGVEVKPKSGSLVLDFDLGGRLTVRPLSRKKRKEVWLLYEHKGKRPLSVRSDGKFSYNSRNDDAEWTPI